MTVANGSFNWQGTLQNTSDSPITLALDEAALHFQDSTGGPVEGQVQDTWPNEAVPPRGQAAVTFRGYYDALPAGLRYVDLVIDSVGGHGPFTFRRALTLGTAAVGTPAVYEPGARIPLGPSVYLIITKMTMTNGRIDW